METTHKRVLPLCLESQQCSPADAEPLFVYCLVIFIHSRLHLQSESLMAITCAQGVTPQHMPVCDLSPSTSWHRRQHNIWLWLVPHFGLRFLFSHGVWKSWEPKMIQGANQPTLRWSRAWVVP